jgi:hypothetical protein
LAADRVQALVERHRRALERLQRQRDGDDGRVEHAARVAQRQAAGRGHQVRPVDQRQPLLGLELDRREPGAPQRGGARHPLAVDERLALADQDQREMGERRQVARRSDRAAARDDRHDAALEQRQQQLDELDAHT